MRLKHLLSNDEKIISKYNNVRKLGHEEIKEEQELSESKMRSDEGKQGDSLSSPILHKNPFKKSSGGSPGYQEIETPEFLHRMKIAGRKDNSQPRKRSLIFNFKTLPKKNKRKKSVPFPVHDSNLFNFN